MEKKSIAVVCVSGGMDSTLALAIASSKHDVALLHVDYGQLTEGKERDCFERLVEWYDVPSERVLRVKTDVLQKVGASCLTDRNIEVPKDGVKPDKIPVSYVPFRNGNILAMATSFAEAIGAKAIYTGFVEEDSSGYPDCREEFVFEFEKAMAAGTKPTTTIHIMTPCIHMTKAEIVHNTLRMRAPVHLTWSCYANSDVACGRCDSCQLRLHGFTRAGYIDPIPYAINIDWKHCKEYTPRKMD